MGWIPRPMRILAVVLTVAELIPALSFAMAAKNRLLATSLKLNQLVIVSVMSAL